MARFKISPGLDNYTKKLQELQMKTRDELIGKAVYKGAGIVADAMQTSITYRLRTHPDPHQGVTKEQKDGLHRGLGISRMRDDNGFINVKIGFDGYNAIINKKYPKGQPNALVARSLVKGTSTAPKQDFVTPVVKQTESAAENAMEDVIDSGIEKIMS